MERVKHSIPPPKVCSDCHWKGAYLAARSELDRTRATLEELQAHHKHLRLQLLKKRAPTTPAFRDPDARPQPLDAEAQALRAEVARHRPRPDEDDE